MNWLSNLASSAASEPDLLTFNRGIEREALRVTPNGELAQSPHPRTLGSKLTHPKITTDFSESQLELITPVQQGIHNTLQELDRIHRYVYSKLDDEILWSASMPCVLSDDSAIPLAYFGESNIGRLKTTYRNGLGHRYGRGMQTICAIHYNFSFPDAFWQWLHQSEQSTEALQTFINRRYFDLMRNFRRFSWLLTYLFGASPAVCRSFVRDKPHGLEMFDEGTAYLPNATSLRSGNLGYQSDIQAAEMNVCYNALDDYVSTLATAISTPHSRYQEIGVHVGNEYKQVNANILQTEAEFYSSIRAKRVPGQGENFLKALKQDGVSYIEVRLLDVDPYLPLGISDESIRFIDTFLLYCLLHDSPFHDDKRCNEVKTNTAKTVLEGRCPSVQLLDNGASRSLPQWGDEILGGVGEVASMLDNINSTTAYSRSVGIQREKIADPDKTPSGKILKDMQANQIPFFRFAMNQSLAHQQHFNDRKLSDDDQRHFDGLASESLTQQATIDSAEQMDFDDYLAKEAAAYLPLCKAGGEHGEGGEAS